MKRTINSISSIFALWSDNAGCSVGKHPAETSRRRLRCKGAANMHGPPSPTHQEAFTDIPNVRRSYVRTGGAPKPAIGAGLSVFWALASFLAPLKGVTSCDIFWERCHTRFGRQRRREHGRIAQAAPGLLSRRKNGRPSVATPPSLARRVSILSPCPSAVNRSSDRACAVPDAAKNGVLQGRAGPPT